MYTISLPVGTYVIATVNPRQADDDPAELDGPVTAEVLSGDVLVSVDDDQITISAPHSISEGTAQVRVSADVRLGEGVRELDEIININLVEEAVTFGLTFGEPIGLE